MMRSMCRQVHLSNEESFPTIERVLIVSWLMTDLGWMTTNILIGVLVLHAAMSSISFVVQAI